MSLGLPSHLARSAQGRALASASHWGAFVALGAALANILISGIGHEQGWYWLTIVALVPMGVLLVVLSRRRTRAMTIAYLAVGMMCTFLYAATLLAQTPSYHNTNLFTIALPVVAMTFVGGAGSGVLIGIIWSTIGFASAEIAVGVAAAVTGRQYEAEAISLGAYLLIIAVLLFDGVTQGRRNIPQSTIHRALRDGQAVRVRQELEIESAADLHDNAISELLTIAASTPGPLRMPLRRRIEEDLRQLGQDRASGDHRHTLSDASVDLWQESELNAAIEVARDEGLTVEVSGDRSALSRLSPERRRAIGLAVGQCLMNVLRHSGSASADVAIATSEEEFSVMVVDAGRGFVQSETGLEGLGLRHSVQDRIERVGGSVTVWSSPNVGTTVMLVVPGALGRDDEAPEPESGREIAS